MAMNEGTKLFLGIMLLGVSFLIIMGSAGILIINYESPSNTKTNSTTVTGGSGGTTVIGGGININNKGYGAAGNKNISKKANVGIILTKFYIDSNLNVGQTLYDKIYLLPANDVFKTYATFDITGGNIKVPVKISFYLEQGSLPDGSLHHVKGTKVLTEGTKIFANGLSEGKHTIEINGRTPQYNPGHDWYLPYVVATIKNVATVKYEAKMNDNPTQDKWLALQYTNEWCIPNNIKNLNGCLKLTSSTGNNVNIEIYTNKGFGNSILGMWLSHGQISKAVIYEITYPGKAVMVYDSKPIGQRKLGQNAVYIMTIPKSRFATVTSNEAYLKIEMYNNNGKIINLNNAPKDKSARINIPIQVIGSTEWTYTKQYFDSLGVISFNSLGMNIGQHSPESQYFTSVW